MANKEDVVTLEYHMNHLAEVCKDNSEPTPDVIMSAGWITTKAKSVSPDSMPED
jgi:hypothetical protein